MELSPQTRASSTDWFNDGTDSDYNNLDSDDDDELDELSENDMNADTLDESNDMFMNPTEDASGDEANAPKDVNDMLLNPTEDASDDEANAPDDVDDMLSALSADSLDDKAMDPKDSEDDEMALFNSMEKDNQPAYSTDDLLSDEQSEDITEDHSKETRPSDTPQDEPSSIDDVHTLEPDASTSASLFERIKHFFTDSIPSGIQATNQADVHMVETIGSSTNRVQEYTITYFVMKLFLLACVIGYAASIDIRMCPCANNFRKPVILIGGGIVMALCLLAMVLPQMFTWMPFLKAFLMTLTFVVLYCILTYFPLLRNSDCECSEQDWRRWVVEGIVYITIALFVLTLLGVISM